MHSMNWESYSFMRVGYVVGGGGAIRNYRTLRATAREPTSCRLRKGQRTCRTGGQAQGADHRHTVVYVHPFSNPISKIRSGP